MKYINIEVKPEDLVGAIPYNPQYCPVARALKRRYKHVGIHVGTTKIEVGTKTYTTSYSLSDAISTYDETGRFEIRTYRAYLKDES